MFFLWERHFLAIIVVQGKSGRSKKISVNWQNNGIFKDSLTVAAVLCSERKLRAACFCLYTRINWTLNSFFLEVDKVPCHNHIECLGKTNAWIDESVAKVMHSCCCCVVVSPSVLCWDRNMAPLAGSLWKWPASPLTLTSLYWCSQFKLNQNGKWGANYWGTKRAHFIRCLKDSVLQ